MANKYLSFGISIAFFFLSIHFSFSQNKYIDSLLANIPEVQDEAFVDHLVMVSRKHPELDSALLWGNRALQKANELGYEIGAAKANYFIAQAYMDMKHASSALPFLDLAKPVFEKESDWKQLARVHRSKGYCYRELGQSMNALEEFQTAVKYTEKSGDMEMKADMLFAIGDFYRTVHNIENALSYLEKSDSIYLLLGADYARCKVIYTKGITWKIGKSTEQQLKGIDYMLELIDGPCWSSISKLLKGKVHTTLGSMYSFIKEYDKVEEHLLKGIEYKEEVNAKGSLIYSYNELATFYNDIKEHHTAIGYGELAFELVKDIDDASLKYDILRELSEAYSLSGNYEKGHKLMMESVYLRDTVLFVERAAALVEMETKYNLAVKEEELAKKDLEIAQQQNRLSRFILFAILGAVLLAGIFIWMRYRLSKRAMEAKQMRELEKLRTAFFTNISHEFRTPLSLILAPLRKLENEFAERRKYYGEDSQNSRSIPVHVSDVRRMGRNAERLEKLINQLLDLSKMDAGKMPLRVSEGDLADFVQHTVGFFDEMAQQRNVQLQCACFHEPMTGFFDSDVLEKVINNLVSNALKFTPEGGKVKVLLTKKDGLAEIVVTDTGKGVSQNELPHIFDRFYQAKNNETANWNTAGSGIGLALVKELVQLHKGTIKVTSLIGKGTTFQILIPLQADQFGKSALNDTIAMRPAESPSLINKFAEWQNEHPDLEGDAKSGMVDTNRPVVLIIEDNTDLREYLISSLKNMYDIWSAENGEEGVEIAFAKIPDLIISDVMMPGMDGIEVSEKLKSDERTSHIPIILLTAKAAREDELKGLETGADDYLTKPFDEGILLKKIDNLIQQRQSLKLRFAEKIELRPHELKVDSYDEAFLKKLLDIVEHNMSDATFSIEQMSSEIGLSRSQLFRKLKALTGETPTVFVRSLRLRRAKQLLEQQYGNVNEVAFKVGFNNTSYFFKCFKEMFGVTPGEVVKSRGQAPGVTSKNDLSGS